MTLRPRLRVVSDNFPSAQVAETVDPMEFQRRCVEGFIASQVARGFSALTIDNGTGVLERFLTLAEKPAWELTAFDVDAVVAALVERGVGPVTRRDYVSTFKHYFQFLQARHFADVEARFGIRLADPIDVFHAGHHVTSESPATRPPPSPERMEDFFTFLRVRMDQSRKWAPIARDYALFRTLYHAGLRSAESSTLEIRDLHFDRGPFGKIHVRLGKAAKGSGPRPRWVPMLDDLGLILHWYLDEVRPKFRGSSPALFCDEGGRFMNSGSIRNRLATLCKAEGRPIHEQFSPHNLRHACATRNYERGVDLIAIQQMLGHWNVGTTMRYVTPSSTFVEDAYRRAITTTLAEAIKEEK